MKYEKERYCQTFCWEDIVKICCRFYANTFEAWRKMSYVVQDQWQTVLGKLKLFVIAVSVDVSEVAWYINQSESKSSNYN